MNGMNTPCWTREPKLSIHYDTSREAVALPLCTYVLYCYKTNTVAMSLYTTRVIIHIPDV